MSALVEVVYFHKRCLHCKKTLDRIQKMSMAWSQCNNEACPFLLEQTNFVEDPEPWKECFNRQ